mgnify:FL=1
MSSYYLNEGLPRPKPSPLDAPFWEGLQNNVLKLQYCRSCGSWQWGPEWICHHCLSDNLIFREVNPEGTIYSYERVWHPVHPALAEQGAYLIVLVEMPEAGNVRLVGNLVGDPHQVVEIGKTVKGVFEHHSGEEPYSLLNWALV